MEQKIEFSINIAILASIVVSIFLMMDYLEIGLIVMGSITLVMWLNVKLVRPAGFIIIIMGFIQVIYAIYQMVDFSTTMEFSSQLVAVLALRGLAGVMAIATGFRLMEFWADRDVE